MNKEQKSFFRLVVCLTPVLILCGCHGEKLPKDLAAYSLDEERIASINAALNDEELGKHLSGMEIREKIETGPEDEAQNGNAPSGASEDDSSAGEAYTAYRYSGLEGTGELVLRYVEALTTENEDFQMADNAGAAVEPPDYAQEAGEILLTRRSDEEGQLLRIKIAWEPAGLCITLDRTADEGTQPETEPMTNNDAVEYLKGLSPARLGLPGDSMRDYQIYPIDGSAQVDGVPCLKLQVYRPRSPENTNDIAGVFLLTGDCKHLYRLEDGRVTEVSAF